MTTSVLPVAVMKRSPISAASAIGITSKPSINASKARTGSTSVTITLDPIPFALNATPRPTQPNPATTTHLPAKRRFVARMIPSSADCPVPYLLSKRCFVRASLTAMTGNFSRPSFSIARNLVIPVVVSSQAPKMFSTNRLPFRCVATTSSAPSSIRMSGFNPRTRSRFALCSLSVTPLQA